MSIHKAFHITFSVVLIALSSMLFQAQGQTYFDNVVIVLDASGSMKQRMPGTQTKKMDAAKKALIEVLKTLPQSTQIGLLVFSAKDLKDDWVFPLGPREDNELIPAIQKINPNHGTPLGQYIKEGADRLLEQRAEQFGYGTYRLLVVTDGEANDGDLVRQYVPEVLSRGIVVDVIGVAMKENHTLATKVHSYRSANDEDSLKQAIAEVFAEVGSSSNDLNAEEAFEILAGIPDELAQVAIQTLAGSGNNPIGQSNTAPEEATENTRTSSRNVPHQTQTTTVAPVKVRVTNSRSLIMVVGLMGIILLVIMKALFGRR